MLRIGVFLLFSRRKVSYIGEIGGVRIPPNSEYLRIVEF